ncbi:MAG: hypothetical protein AAF291_12830 [Pseudomonadota bacterium]
MTSASITTSKPDHWTVPRPFTDASVRLQKHGPIRPLEEPGFLERLFSGM